MFYAECPNIYLLTLQNNILRIFGNFTILHYYWYFAKILDVLWYCSDNIEIKRPALTGNHKVAAHPCGGFGELHQTRSPTFLFLRNSSIEECLEYSCCPASCDGLGAPPQWDLHIPTSTLTGLPEMSEERKKQNIFDFRQEWLLQSLTYYSIPCFLHFTTCLTSITHAFDGKLKVFTDSESLSWTCGGI